MIAHRDFAITNTPQSYHWEQYGFRLHVPEGSLEAGLSETTVSVQVSLSGQFKLPADSKLVSAVYWIQPLQVLPTTHCNTVSLLVSVQASASYIPHVRTYLINSSSSKEGSSVSKASMAVHQSATSLDLE